MGTVLNIKDDAIEMAVKGQCLTISKNQNINTSKGKPISESWFTMKSEECTESRLTVCKLEKDKHDVTHDPPPQFPCISKSDRREKRELRAKRGGSSTNEIGVLILRFFT